MFEKTFAPNSTPYSVNMVKENSASAVVGNRIQIIRTDGGRHLQLAEVEVYGTEGGTASAGAVDTTSGTVTVSTSPSTDGGSGVINIIKNDPTTLPEIVFTAAKPQQTITVSLSILNADGARRALATLFSAFSATITKPDGTTETLNLFARTEARDANATIPLGSFSLAQGEKIKIQYRATPTSALGKRELKTAFSFSDGSRMTAESLIIEVKTP